MRLIYGEPSFNFKLLGFFSAGLLSLPSQFNSVECNSNSPVKYMESHESSCQRSLETITDCSEVEVFRASSFTRAWKVVASPDMVMGENETEMKELSQVIFKWTDNKY